MVLFFKKPNINKLNVTKTVIHFDDVIVLAIITCVSFRLKNVVFIYAILIFSKISSVKMVIGRNKIFLLFLNKLLKAPNSKDVYSIG